MKEALVFLLQQSTILLILLDEFSRPAKKFSIIDKSVSCNLYPRLLSFNVLDDRNNLTNIPVYTEHFIPFYHRLKSVNFNYRQTINLIVRDC